MARYWVQVTYSFWADHASRCMTRDYATFKYHGMIKQVELEGFEIANLLSDADYYASEWREMGRECIGLGRSARVQAERIRKQFRAYELEDFAVEWREIEGGK